MKLAEEGGEMISSDNLREEGQRMPYGLPAVGLMAELPEALRERLAASGEFVERQPGAYLAIQGQPHSAMSFILEGKVALSAHAHGDMVQLGVLSCGDVVGEMSLIDPHVASANARVVGDTPASLWIITSESYQKFLDSNLADGFTLMHAMAKVLCRRVRKDSELMLRRSAELRERYLDMDY